MSLAVYASHIQQHHVEALADAYLDKIRELDVPLMARFTHLSDEELRAMSVAGLQVFLTDLAAGRALETAQESLRRWEADELPGFKKEDVEPSDLALIYAAQKDALLSLLSSYAETVPQAMSIARELEAFFSQVQNGAFKLYAKIHAASVERDTQLRTAQEFAEELQASNEELQAQTEELQSQAEELASQTEELQGVYDLLRRHTDEVEAEVAARTQELQLRQRQLAAAQRLADTGSWDYEVASGAVTWSDHLFRLHGYEPGAFEVSFQTVQRHTHPDDAAVLREKVARALETGEGYDVEYRIVRPDGQTILARTRAEVMLGPDGKPQRLTGVSMDVTAQRRAQEDLARQAADLAEANRRLVEADRYKNEFLAVISHELRTPLNFITGFTSVMLDGVGGEPNPTHLEYLTKISAGADRLLLLVNDLLDFAALRTGTLSIRREAVNLTPVINEAVALVQPQAAGKRIELISDTRFTARANVDAGRIQQVLVNLIGNAVKFTPDGGRIEVRGWTEANQAVLEVEDNGPGIPEDQISRVFQHFTQLDMGATRQAGGVGLGLAIVRRLVQAHGGSVEVKSVLGEGSVFRVCLPLEGTGRLEYVQLPEDEGVIA